MSLAVLCPGQGSQHPGMFDKLAHEPLAGEVLAHAATVLGKAWRDILGDPRRLFDNRHAQPLLCLAQYAAWRALEDVLGQASAIAGYSAGEVSAYACAGGLDAEVLAHVASERARLMDEYGRPGGLLALHGLPRGVVENLCRARSGHLAIVIAADSHVVGAAADALPGLACAAEIAGAQITHLKVGVPSHTPLMQDAVEPLAHLLHASMRGTLQKPVIAGVTADRVFTREQAVETLSRQVAQTIEWSACMDALHERGCRVFIELGPGSTLSRMIMQRWPDVRARSLEDFRSLEGARAWLARAMDDTDR